MRLAGRALTAILLLAELVYVRELWNSREGWRPSFLQTEVVEVEGVSGGEESADVDAEVEGEA